MRNRAVHAVVGMSLILGLVWATSSLTALADPSMRSDSYPAPRQSNEVRYYKLVLEHSDVMDILRMLDWRDVDAVALPESDAPKILPNASTSTEVKAEATRLPRDVVHIHVIRNENASAIQETPAPSNLNADPGPVRIEVDLVTGSLDQITSVVLRKQGAPHFGEFRLDQEHVQLALNGAIVTPIATFIATSDTTVPVVFPPSTLTYAPKMPDGLSLLELTPRVNPDNTITLLPDWARVDGGETSSARTSEQRQPSASLRTVRTVQSGESMIIGDYAPAYAPDPPPGLMSMSDIEGMLSPWRKSTADVGKYILITPTIVDSSGPQGGRESKRESSIE